MPSLAIHLISDMILVAAIYYFDRAVRTNKRLMIKIGTIILCSNLIDIDHLLATPIYDPLRCSINTHPLHSWYIMPFYIIGLLLKNRLIRYFCLAVLTHLWLDWVYCLF